MPRPKRCRRIGRCPEGRLFKPQGVPSRELEQVALGLDELEAVRLVDLEGLGQAEASSRMKVSQPTFSRVLAQGRRHIAEALVGGKALRIAEEKGGHIEIVEDRA